MTSKEKHIQVLEELHQKHLATMKETDEFIWDGPSNWGIVRKFFSKNHVLS